jgi:riboflavin kinase/FMN adenylyltransferase
VVSFTKDFAAVLPEDFIESCLISLKTKWVVVGVFLTFGHRAQGTAKTLREMSRDRYRLAVVNPVTLEGEKVSSTLVREMLHEGNMERVSRLLGRPYRVEGKVVSGERRGRTIGFPTANLALHEPYFIPRTGVYVVGVECLGRHFYGVANLGYKPTFHSEKMELSIEIHLLDFSGDVYGETIGVQIFRYLRTEKKFPSVEVLVQQIHADVAQARQWIQTHPAPFDASR